MPAWAGWAGVGWLGWLGWSELEWAGARVINNTSGEDER